MDALGVIDETRRLIEFGWCRGSDARDAHGAAVPPGDPTATEWSLLGALGLVAAHGDVGLEQLATALAALAELIADPSLSHWNDAPGRTQEEVVATLAGAQTALEDGRVLVQAMSRN
jgi:hypothetical protein